MIVWITVCWQCRTAMLLFSLCSLFQVTCREKPCSPARCRHKVIKTWWHTVILFWIHLFVSLLILPVNDAGNVDMQSGFFQLLLCTFAHLNHRSGTNSWILDRENGSNSFGKKGILSLKLSILQKHLYLKCTHQDNEILLMLFIKLDGKCLNFNFLAIDFYLDLGQVPQLSQSFLSRQ